MKKLGLLLALLFFVSSFIACTPQAIEGTEKVSPDTVNGNILVGKNG